MFFKRTIKYYLRKNLQIRVSEKDIYFTDLYTIQFSKFYIENYLYLEHRIFLVCNDFVLSKNVLTIDTIDSTVIYLSDEEDYPVYPRVNIDKLDQCDQDNLDVIEAINALLNRIIETCKLVIQQIKIKYVFHQHDLFCDIQSLHIQGEPDQTIGIYVKNIDITFLSSRILSIYKLIIILPYSLEIFVFNKLI